MNGFTVGENVDEWLSGYNLSLLVIVEGSGVWNLSGCNGGHVRLETQAVIELRGARCIVTGPQTTQVSI